MVHVGGMRVTQVGFWQDRLVVVFSQNAANQSTCRGPEPDIYSTHASSFVRAGKETQKMPRFVL